MKKIILSPSKYVQSDHVLQEIVEHVKTYGKNAVIIFDGLVSEKILEEIALNLKEKDILSSLERFKGETSKKEIKRLQKQIINNSADFLIGIGDEKVLDATKIAADELNLPIVIIPMLGSTDNAINAMCSIYTEQGEFDGYYQLKQCPNLILVDTNIITNAPTKYIIAGMGAALASYFELRSNVRASSLSGCQTQTAKAMAKLSYDLLLEKGLQAKIAVDQNIITPAVEDIIEVNIYLTGIVFQSGGLATAHAIANGMLILEELINTLKGERLAFSVIAQLVLEDAPLHEIQEVIRFCQSIGLPINFKELGIDHISKNHWLDVAKIACAPGETMHNMTIEISPVEVYEAILGANELGMSL